MTDPILRRFRLSGGLGYHVFPEGRPVDIALLHGTRAVVLHTPLRRYGWSGGRICQHMTPTLAPDRFIKPAEAETGWLAPFPREHDFMPVNDTNS